MTKSKPDRSLVRLIIKARTYHELVLGNRDRVMKDLVDEAGVTRSDFIRAMRLTYLAPDIVRSIVDGTQPPGLTAAKMIAPPGFHSNGRNNGFFSGLTEPNNSQHQRQSATNRAPSGTDKHAQGDNLGNRRLDTRPNRFS